MARAVRVLHKLWLSCTEMNRRARVSGCGDDRILCCGTVALYRRTFTPEGGGLWTCSGTLEEEGVPVRIHDYLLHSECTMQCFFRVDYSAVDYSHYTGQQVVIKNMMSPHVRYAF